MYRVHHMFNYLGTIILQLAYVRLGYKINLKYEYNDGLEFLIGILVTTILMNILDWFFYAIAYKLTGFFSRSCGYDSSDRKVVHWFIRVILYIAIYVVSITPLCSIILTPVVQYFTKAFIEWFNKFTTDFTNALLAPITNSNFFTRWPI